MSTPLSVNAPTTFEIKSANLPLVALLLKSADLSRLSVEFAHRFGEIPDFFDNDPLVIDLFPLQAAEPGATVDFDHLLGLLRERRLRPLAVRGGDAAQMASALSAGLIAATDAVVNRATAAAPSPAVAPVTPLPTPSALVIDKPLRSGQRVYARGRDLVVMAMVNRGAEVVADGHIHVYAPLRGKAIAGARGNADARIFSLLMDPELISIAGIYRTSEKPLPAEVQGKAAQVRLTFEPDGERLVVDAISI